MRNVLFIFGQLTDSDVEWLSQHGRRHPVRAGDTLIHEGRPIDSIYVVLEGTLSVTRAADGEVLRQVGPGEMLGEMSFVDAAPPSATVTAESDGYVLAIPRDKLAARLESEGGFAARFYRAVAMMLSDRLRSTDAGFVRGRGAAALDRDELDPNVLDAVNRAGERFERLLKQHRG